MSDESANEHGLPEDVNDWPIDPAELLGVGNESSRQDLRRAYARLIKRYKPEHAPEQFRRLRAAYEVLERQIGFRETSKIDPQQTPEADEVAALYDLPTEEDAESSKDRGRTGNGTEPRLDRLSRAESRRKTSDDVWQEALDGRDLKLVYRELLNETRSGSSTEMDYVRLYWLLTLDFRLAPIRDPSAWLIDGIRRHGMSGRLFQLLETDIRRRDGQVADILSADLLQLPLSTNDLVNFVDLRWYAAHRQQNLELIDRDYRTIKHQFLDELGLWLRLISMGIHHVILSPTSDLLDRFEEELSQFHFSPVDQGIWDSVDLCRNLHHAWIAAQKARNRPLFGMPPLLESIIQVVEATWERSPEQSRPAIMKFCKTLTDVPLK